MLVHLMLELYGCDRQLLSNEPLIRRVLDEYPGRVGMERVNPVHLYDIETSNPLDAGLSGFVVIAQSHISLLIYSYTLLSLLRMLRTIGAPVPFVVDHYPLALPPCITRIQRVPQDLRKNLAMRREELGHIGCGDGYPETNVFKVASKGITA